MRNRKVAVAFGRILREAREKRGVTQEELAHRAGLDRTYPSMLELGKRQPTLGVLLTVAEVLDVSPVTLLSRTIEALGD